MSWKRKHVCENCKLEKEGDYWYEWETDGIKKYFCKECRQELTLELEYPFKFIEFTKVKQQEFIDLILKQTKILPLYLGLPINGFYEIVFAFQSKTSNEEKVQTTNETTLIYRVKFSREEYLKIIGREK